MAKQAPEVRVTIPVVGFTYEDCAKLLNEAKPSLRKRFGYWPDTTFYAMENMAEWHLLAVNERWVEGQMIGEHAWMLPMVWPQCVLARPTWDKRKALRQ